ncbi:MAG: DUF3293 domain-containing protein [Candidatus Sericytochromatia bacterium]
MQIKYLGSLTLTEIQTPTPTSQLTCQPHHTGMTPDLLRAYWETAYHVISPEGTWILHPGQGHTDFDRWLAETFPHVSFWAIITAWNPYSHPRTLEENTQANAHLAACLRAANYPCLPARGVPLSGDWHPEESWLIPGLDAQAACGWGMRYHQNALLWGQTGEEALLLNCTTGAQLRLPAAPDVHEPPGHSPPHQP